MLLEILNLISETAANRLKGVTPYDGYTQGKNKNSIINFKFTFDIF